MSGGDQYTGPVTAQGTQRAAVVRSMSDVRTLATRKPSDISKIKVVGRQPEPLPEIFTKELKGYLERWDRADNLIKIKTELRVSDKDFTLTDPDQYRILKLFPKRTLTFKSGLDACLSSRPFLSLVIPSSPSEKRKLLESLDFLAPSVIGRILHKYLQEQRGPGRWQEPGADMKERRHIERTTGGEFSNASVMGRGLFSGFHSVNLAVDSVEFAFKRAVADGIGIQLALRNGLSRNSAPVIDDQILAFLSHAGNLNETDQENLKHLATQKESFDLLRLLGTTNVLREFGLKSRVNPKLLGSLSALASEVRGRVDRIYKNILSPNTIDETVRYLAATTLDWSKRNLNDR